MINPIYREADIGGSLHPRSLRAAYAYANYQDSRKWLGEGGRLKTSATKTEDLRLFLETYVFKGEK